ncbi:type IV secretion protein Dot [Legionella israelensis]|uniref:type IV secretion protein Dot n=1 Tax=Legionella israelensis TaxID=454 RepID=UPI00117E3D98|nr:type IV secretion protein Dot [Legionella israelensis]QDP72399.1 type IV secretion protein Dot [Legionella israelensis]
MGYVLPVDAIKKLKNLRKDYEKIEGVDLKQPPSFFGLPTALGGTNVSSREKQISLIEKIIAVLESNLLDDEQITSQQQYEAKYSASKMIIAVCLYIRSQISPTYKVRSAKNSDLYSLLDEALGLHGYNTMSEEDKIECFNTAARLMSIKGAFEDANATLLKAGIPVFSEEEWNEFSSFVNKKSKLKKSDYDFVNWPCTSISKPLFGYVGSTVGATAGILSGHIISTSTPLFPSHNYAAATIGNGIILFGIGSTLGTPFIAPIIASKLMDTFLQIFLAKSLHYAMQLVGEGLGVAIGLPLDYAYHLLCKAYGSIYEYMGGEKPAGLTGLRIIDGKQMVNGLVIETKPVKESSLTEEQKENAILINRDGTCTIGKHTFNINKDIMPHVIEELEKRLSEKSASYEDLNVSSSAVLI